MPLTLDGTAGMTAPQGAVYNGLATATVQNSTSGTSIDFTGTPLWVKRVTIMFSSVALSGSDDLLVQFGSCTFTTSGYVSVSTRPKNSSATQSASATNGFVVFANSSSLNATGHMVLTQISTNLWVSSHTTRNDLNPTTVGGGNVTLSGTLDRVRITATGSNTFSAGSINIMYE